MGASEAAEPSVHRSVEDLAAEQGITAPQPLDTLTSTALTDEERQAFVEAAEDRHPCGWFCPHYTITASLGLGVPTVGCGCEMTPLQPTA